jgi:L-seryl-tRNA(Ser) seleniumtransferase
LLERKLSDAFQVAVVDCTSQIGSGALPLETLPSAGIAISPAASRGQGRALAAVAEALRKLPVPVIGRVADGALILDLRCLEDESGFAANLAALNLAEARNGQT